MNFIFDKTILRYYIHRAIHQWKLFESKSTNKSLISLLKI